MHRCQQLGADGFNCHVSTFTVHLSRNAFLFVWHLHIGILRFRIERPSFVDILMNSESDVLTLWQVCLRHRFSSQTVVLKSLWLFFGGKDRNGDFFVCVCVCEIEENSQNNATMLFACLLLGKCFCIVRFSLYDSPRSSQEKKMFKLY
jgi:hypothetical protein